MKCPKCGEIEFIQTDPFIEGGSNDTEGRLYLQVRIWCEKCNIDIEGYEFVESRIE